MDAKGEFAEPEFPIMVNEAAMTIAVGPRIWTRPFLSRLGELNFGIKEEVCGPSPSTELKAMHKFYCDKLGPKFNRRFCAANYHLWISRRMSVAVANMLRNRGNRWRAYSEELVCRANEVLPYIAEAEKDGLLHLVPAIVVFQGSPSAIRQRIGGAAWRQIAHNSLTRNRKLMQVADSLNRKDQGRWDAAFLDSLAIPSGVLANVHNGSLEEQIAGRLAPRKTPAIFEQTQHIVRDTMRMTGDAFNPDWSLARMNEEHDKASRNRYRQKYSAKPFAPAWNFTKDGFTATLLTSPVDIVAEGDSMHHCVGSYAQEAAKRRYLVLRIDGKERATAGYTPFGQMWKVDQVYGACNVPASETCRIFAIEASAMYTADQLAIAA